MERRTLLGRRSFLCAAAGIAPGVGAAHGRERTPIKPNPLQTEQLLDEVERRACQYFWEQADPTTGLVRDRARRDGSEQRQVASVAATGFGLSALCIADLRGYLPAEAIRGRVTMTLDFLAARSPHQQGFYYHFVDVRTGERVWQSELSSVDTAWLLCGVLHCREHFDSPAIRRMAGDVLDRVDWRWMLNGGELLSHGWRPERGFLPYRWDSYSELLAMYLLALGSQTSTISASSWHSWARPESVYEGRPYIAPAAPLFVHQYSHGWFDFRGRRDRYADYFENSRCATAAHRDFCISLAPRFPWYGTDMWGVTASDSRSGYRVWGDPSSPPDGTLTPCAAGGSIVFLPQECALVLTTMLERYGSKVWCRYGFVDAFQPGSGWYSRDVIGINQGIMLLMAENLRSGAVWEAVARSPEAQRGMAAAGLATDAETQS